MHQPQEFGHDKTPLYGGGRDLYGLGVFKHRASQLAANVARSRGCCEGTAHPFPVQVLAGALTASVTRVSRAPICRSTTPLTKMPLRGHARARYSV